MIRAPLISSAALLNSCKSLASFRSGCTITRVRYLSDIAGKSDLAKTGLGSESIHAERTEPVSPSIPVRQSVGDVQLAPFIINGDWTMMHPVYTPEEVKAVQIARHKISGFSDWFAITFVRMMRGGFDLATGYRHADYPKHMTAEEIQKMTIPELQKRGIILSEEAWLTRFLVLESVAAVPGMVARTAHRLVGYLEEEAVLTYTRAIKELEAGHLPAWTDKPSPEIARQYWKLPKDSTLLDVLYGVRMDEATHRMVNHTLASLDQDADSNPFALGEPDAITRGSHPGFSREESIDFARKVAAAVSEKQKEISPP